MKSDISRKTFDPVNNFSRVIMQQGRVQLDADWNEQADILLHYLRALAEDIIGPHGGPTDLVDLKGIVTATRCGFKIGPSPDSNAVNDLAIGPGRYYVAGLLCEVGDNQKYFEQSFYPLNPQADPPDRLPEIPYLVYLDVWERAVSSLDYPSLSEVALEGADTAMRAQVVWQVKAIEFNELDPRFAFLDKPDPCQQVDVKWNLWQQTFQPQPRGMLKARVQPQSKEADPCLTSPESSYRGTENLLYRIEVHKGGLIGDRPTFKWSRDNGSNVAAWLGMAGNDLTVASVRDSARGFGSGQWIELSYDAQELKGLPGTMVQVAQVSGDTLTVQPPIAPSPQVEWSENFAHPKVRRWDQQATDEIELQDGVIKIVEGSADDDTWITLEDGIQIQFQPPAAGSANTYRTGDYWLIPARTATGDIEWPNETDTNGIITGPSALEPDGIKHFYAPLAAIRELNKAVDLRHQFSPQGGCVGTKSRGSVLIAPPPPPVGLETA